MTWSPKKTQSTSRSALPITEYPRMHPRSILLLIVLITVLACTVAVEASKVKSSGTTGKNPLKPKGGGVAKKKAGSKKLQQQQPQSGTKEITFPGGTMACHKLHFLLALPKGATEMTLSIKPKEEDPKKRNANRIRACGVASKPTASGKQRTWADGDEFPFNSATTGGARASVFCVPDSESSNQGGKLSHITSYNKAIIKFDGSDNHDQVIKTCLGHLKKFPKAKGKHLSSLTSRKWIFDKDPVVYILLLIVLITILACPLAVEAAKGNNMNTGKKPLKGKGGMIKKGGGQKYQPIAKPKQIGTKEITFPGGVMACHKLHFLLALPAGAATITLQIKPKELDTKKANANRAKACGIATQPKKGTQRKWADGTTSNGAHYCNKLGLVCDEFPFNSAKTGGARASVFCVPPTESSKQGGKMSHISNYKEVVVDFDGSDNPAQVIKTCLKHLRTVPEASGVRMSSLTTRDWRFGDNDPVI
ncbi:hypothetical protein HDU97_010240 [Phlyctochytrium planicorne]|nr:hypothetical protein HDU97_010240 [Phlyctochytrium planicorne]